jgi:TrmH family RNA methyltransferase
MKESERERRAGSGRRTVTFELYSPVAMDPARAVFVLVRPSRAANVAAACRAMKNMGARNLRLVDPPGDLDEREARSLAYGAWDVLDGAERFATLREAVADRALVAATSGRGLPAALSPRRFAERAAAAGPLAVVFGPEASGLKSDELALCEATIRIPTDAAQPSLNLAQAVLVIAYELFLAAQAPAAATAPARAAAGEVNVAISELGDALAAVGYLNPQNPAAILTELAALIRRAAPTAREVALLRGVARQVLWAARRVAPPEAGADNGRPPEDR